jgi:hypothetical protein
MTTDTRYNGWTNYATWRVHLELLDNLTCDDIGFTTDGDRDDNAWTLKDILKAYVTDIVWDTAPAGIARDYALAFLSDVEWIELAFAMLNNELEEDDA